MRLNALSPCLGSRKSRKRVGRGIGCTLGKTSGKGHKGQKARAGGFTKLGFEGGQMPLQRRLPKVGFHSKRKAVTKALRLDEIAKIPEPVANLKSLRDANLISSRHKVIRVTNSGTLSRAIIFTGLYVSAGARIKIESAGGQVEV